MIASNGDLGTLSAPEPAAWYDRVLDRNSIAQEAAKRLRIAIDRIGGNKGVMDKCGIPSRTLSAHLAGGEMKRGALVALADACGVNIAWLAAGRGPMVGPPVETTSSALELQKSALDRPQKTFATIKIDMMAQAMEAAKKTFRDSGATPEPRELVQVMLLLYDGMNKP